VEAGKRRKKKEKDEENKKIKKEEEGKRRRKKEEMKKKNKKERRRRRRLPSRSKAHPKDSRGTDALPTAVASVPHAVRRATASCAEKTNKQTNKHRITYKEMFLRCLIPAYVSKAVSTPSTANRTVAADHFPRLH
jgi:hypothetical protein